jgi:hypothetical protein
VHNGHRLCKRSIQYALDPATPKIQKVIVTLGLYRGEVCLLIEHLVRALMRNLVYLTKCAFTADDLLAVECGCKARCKNEGPNREGEEKICCTHGATVPLRLSLRLYELLATTFLMDLRTRMHSFDIEAALGSYREKRSFEIT